MRPVGYCISPPLVQVEEIRHGDEEEMTDKLDAVVAWSMRLTDRPLKGFAAIFHPDREIEGHSNMFPQHHTDVLAELAALPWVETIGEVGFNGGHSALRWLMNSTATVYSFDIGEHVYSRPASMWLSKMFPGRLTMIWGDSVTEIPQFQRENPSVKLDLIMVDGGHSYDLAKADLKHFRSLANPKNNRVIMDDTFLDDVRRAWDEMIELGQVEEFQSYSGTIDCGKKGILDYGFSVGRYLFDAEGEDGGS